MDDLGITYTIYIIHLYYYNLPRYYNITHLMLVYYTPIVQQHCSLMPNLARHGTSHPRSPDPARVLRHGGISTYSGLGQNRHEKIQDFQWVNPL